jgi:hypothetical protein
MRVINEKSQINYTAGFILVPPKERAFSLFDAADIHSECISDLNTVDFLPTDADYENIKGAMRTLIEDVIYEHAESENIKLDSRPRSKTPEVAKIPEVKIPQYPPPEILPLPTYDLNEAAFEDMVEILYCIQAQVGMSDEQAKNNRYFLSGDLLSVNGML